MCTFQLPARLRSQSLFCAVLCRYGTLSEGVVSVDAGEGTVEIELVGWFDKIKQRMAGAAGKGRA